MNCGRTICLERELLDARRILIKVAITNPVGLNYEIRDPRPGQVAPAFRPLGEIGLLIACQRYSPRLTSSAFVLNGDLAFPANDERTSGIQRQIVKLAGSVDGIEDDFKFGGDGNSDKGGLWAT